MTDCLVSVVILTRNEEPDLPGCLESVAWSDDIHVFDSFSTDRTVELARARGAAVTQRAFDGYASQRNAALHELPFRHPWVLSLDADERVPRALAEEIAQFAARAPGLVGAGRIRRRDFFLGTWLKHAQISPYFIRLCRPGRVRYEREVNEVVVVNGLVEDLREPFDHYPFSKGIWHWIEKHNRYSTMEARLIAWSSRNQSRFALGKALWSRDFNERRFHQKRLFYSLPARPLLKLAYMLLWRRSFLDGRAGVTYALLQSIYEYFIVLKTRELATNGSARESAVNAADPSTAVTHGTVENPLASP